MALITDFVPYIISNTGSVPEIQIQHLLRMAIASFMRDTHIAQDELYATVDCKEEDFLLDLPDCHGLVQVRDVWRAPANAGHLLDESTWTKLEANEDYRVNTVGRNPNKSVILDTTHNKPTTYCAVYSWKVSADTCEVPDFILDDWVDAIIYRTMVYLHSSLDFEGRNGADSDRALAMYNYEVASARTKLRAQYTRAFVRLKTPRNFY